MPPPPSPAPLPDVPLQQQQQQQQLQLLSSIFPAPAYGAPTPLQPAAFYAYGAAGAPRGYGLSEASAAALHAQLGQVVQQTQPELWAAPAAAIAAVVAATPHEAVQRMALAATISYMQASLAPAPPPPPPVQPPASLPHQIPAELLANPHFAAWFQGFPRHPQ